MSVSREDVIGVVYIRHFGCLVYDRKWYATISQDGLACIVSGEGNTRTMNRSSTDEVKE